MIVTLNDARALNYCNKGIRDFLARHNLDWKEFRLRGLDSEALLATGDEMAERVVEQAKIRDARGGAA